MKDDELAEYDKRVEVGISSGHSSPKPLLDDLESLLIYSSVTDDPHNGTWGVRVNKTKQRTE